jgi:cation diffusion facilitator family transporter
VYAALAANVSIALAKGAGGLFTGSSALVAEAAHSLADSTNQILLLFSLSLSSRKPDTEHPFGHGKERFFWAFLVAVLLFFGGGLFSIGEGVLSIRGGEGERSAQAYLTVYAILLFALVAESLSLLRAIVQLRGEASEDGKPFFAHVRRSTNPTVKVTLYEDAAAVVGVLVALAGTTAARVTGENAYDGAAAVVIGLLLIAVALRLGAETKELLIGAAATSDDRREIRRVIEGHDAIKGLRELLTMHLGPDSILVAARVELDGRLRSTDVAAAMEQLEERLREAVPATTHVFLDPTPAHGAGGRA